MQRITLALMLTGLWACGTEPSEPLTLQGRYELRDLDGVTLPAPLSMADPEVHQGEVTAGFIDFLNDTLAFRQERQEFVVHGADTTHGEYGTAARYEVSGDRLILHYVVRPVIFAQVETLLVVDRALSLRSRSHGADLVLTHVVRRFCPPSGCR